MKLIDFNVLHPQYYVPKSSNSKTFDGTRLTLPEHKEQ